jgi:hypothetical protein
MLAAVADYDRDGEGDHGREASRDNLKEEG